MVIVCKVMVLKCNKCYKNFTRWRDFILFRRNEYSLLVSLPMITTVLHLKWQKRKENIKGIRKYFMYKSLEPLEMVVNSQHISNCLNFIFANCRMSNMNELFYFTVLYSSCTEYSFRLLHFFPLRYKRIEWFSFKVIVIRIVGWENIKHLFYFHLCILCIIGIWK